MGDETGLCHELMVRLVRSRMVYEDGVQEAMLVIRLSVGNPSNTSTIFCGKIYL